MNEALLVEQPAATVEDVMRAELAQGDAVLVSARPILRHLLAHDDHSMFNDEVIARVRGMILDIARQLIVATSQAAGLRDGAQLAEGLQEPLARALLEDTALLAHAHALTLEAQLAERLHARSGGEIVLSSLMQDLIASQDPGTASLAMATLASQARHMQYYRRMELPLEELPGELLHRALLALREAGSEWPDAVDVAEARLRAGFDESAGRLGLLGRLVSAMGRQAPRALEIGHAGLALFTTALALASRQPRGVVVLSLGDQQFARLALALRSAGLKPDDVAAQFHYIHPDVTLPEGFGSIPVELAADMLVLSTPALAG